MDLTTNYMGFPLPNPIVPAASPLSRSLDNLRKMEDAGAAAVVLWSLFEEQIQHEARELEYYLQHGAERFAESLTYFPQEPDYLLGPQEYLEHIRKARKAIDLPLIASLNGISAGGWIDYAEQIEQAGADAIELNVYFLPTDPDLGSMQVETVYAAILQAVKTHVHIPVAMKLSPFFSSMAGMMKKLDDQGADALVLFNRFCQPDIDIENLTVRPALTLSRSADMRLPLRWIAILYGKVNASLAATTGIHTAEDVAKMILAGADVTMMCSALLKNGIGYITKVLGGLPQIMERCGYDSVGQMKGVLSHKSTAEPAAFERANYMKTLQSFDDTATLE